MQCTATCHPEQLPHQIVHLSSESDEARRSVFACANRLVYRGQSNAAGTPFRPVSSKPFLSNKLVSKQCRRPDSVLSRGFGKDTVEGWIDLSKLVSGSGGIKTAYEDLSYKIGKCP